MTNKQKKVYLVADLIILASIAVIIIIFINLSDNKKQRQLETESEIDNYVQTEKNISGIAQYVLFDDSLQYTTQVAHRDIEGIQKECIVVELESVDAWSQIDKEKQIEIVEGLINTSRLQVDKEFGCIVFESVGSVLVEGFWQDARGYVIIEK